MKLNNDVDSFLLSFCMDKHFLAFIPNFVVQIKLIFAVAAFVAVDVEPNIDF